MVAKTHAIGFCVATELARLRADRNVRVFASDVYSNIRRPDKSSGKGDFLVIVCVEREVKAPACEARAPVYKHEAGFREALWTGPRPKRR